jgi:hypothetical protein
MARRATKTTIKNENTAPPGGVPGKQFNTTWHAQFCDLFARSLNVTIAAKGAGVDRATVYEHRKRIPEFAEAFEEARRAAIEKLEAAAYDRANKMSDTLAIFLLKAHKPELYRERNQTTNVNLDLSKLTDAQFQKFDELTEQGVDPVAAYAACLSQ